MAIDKIHLRKLLRLFYARPNLQRRLLLEDIRNERTKKQRKDDDEGGGDFHTAFWADAKDHVAGNSDLREKVKDRIIKNPTRKRLYPLLVDGFLSVWNESIRWRNEKFESNPKTAKGQLPFQELAATVKVENALAVTLWDGRERVIYPYFSEDPSLPEEGARLGLWALREALNEFRETDLRIVDLLRRAYFRSEELEMHGNEREIFVKKYEAILREWEKLRKGA